MSELPPFSISPGRKVFHRSTCGNVESGGPWFPREDLLRMTADQICQWLAEDASRRPCGACLPMECPEWFE